MNGASDNSFVSKNCHQTIKAISGMAGKMSFAKSSWLSTLWTNLGGSFNFAKALLTKVNSGSITTKTMFWKKKV